MALTKLNMAMPFYYLIGILNFIVLSHHEKTVNSTLPYKMVATGRVSFINNVYFISPNVYYSVVS